MNKNYVAEDYIGMTLKQYGASSIERIDSSLNIVKFKITETCKVTYVFNLTKNNKYFLQRTAPIPIQHGKFDSAEDVINFISLDIMKFKDAAKSSNFDTFIEITKKANNILLTMDSLFLNYNVSAEIMQDVSQYLSDTREKICEEFNCETLIDYHLPE